MYIGIGISEIRRARGISQHTLCQKTGITVNYLSQVENCKRQMSLELLDRIAAVLEVPVTYLFVLSDTAADPILREFQTTLRVLMGVAS